MRTKKFLIVIFIVLFLGGILVTMVVLSSLHKSTEHSPAIGSLRRMWAINSCIMQYHSMRGHYPFSDEGKYLVSWRALILPCLPCSEDVNLVNMKYSRDAPWDSDENKKARECLPSDYRSLVNPECKNTVIVAIRSERGIFCKGDEISIDDPNLDNILMIVEVADSGINWLEPRDFTENDLNNIQAVRKVDGKDCIVISMASGRTYILTIENFRQIFPTLITVERDKKIIKEQNGFITTMKIAQ